MGSGSFWYEAVKSGMRWAGGQGQNSVMVISDFRESFISGAAVYIAHEGPTKGPTWGPAAMAEGLRIGPSRGVCYVTQSFDTGPTSGPRVILGLDVLGSHKGDRTR